ncbi:CAP domain-containing protein [Bacillus sp. E214]|uniref:CAP domain-containing protein n=1 Tax=Bacillus sp. E214 TaxID=2587156 RepID=UPI0011DF9F3C|nr:CAP domain-containing protein [Bacillus sp. E214]
MKKYIAGILTVFLSFTVLFLTNSNQVEAASKTMYVTADNLNVREKASSSSKIITAVKKNTKLIVTKKSGNWGYVKVNKKNGWVSINYLTSKAPVTNKTMYTTEKTTLKKLAKNNSGTLKTINKEATIIVYSTTSDKYAKAKYGGKTGWILKSKVKDSKTVTTTSKAAIKYKTIKQNDNTLAKGTTKVVQKGSNGNQTIIYKKTFKNGKLISTKKISSKVTKKAVNQIIKVGTKETKASNYATEVLRLVNQERAKVNIAPLKNLNSLSKVAEVKSKDMRDNNYFNHTSPTYGSPGEMVKKFNISFTMLGENIAAGQITPASVVNSWMNSPGHKANILDARYTHIGIGYAEGGSWKHYWTQLFLKQ